jgi:hypothetical protein
MMYRVDPEAICKAQLTAIAHKSMRPSAADHIADYQKYFNTFAIDLGKGVECQLYQRTSASCNSGKRLILHFVSLCTCSTGAICLSPVAAR